MMLRGVVVLVGSLWMVSSMAGNLRAGAAKVDITPPASALMPGDLIQDRLYVRAIAIDDGSTCSILIGVDQGGLRTDVVDAALEKLVPATHCPAENIIMSATHTHSGSTTEPGGNGLPSNEQLAAAIVSAATTAKAGLRTATLAYGTAEISLNVNRDLYNDRQAWVQGPALAAPSDKTLAVVALVGEDGIPIGVYLNYGMHPINFYQTGVISADFPGAASRYVEQRYDERTVAVFAQGASGDQNPRLIMPRYGLAAIRSQWPELADKRVGTLPPWEVTARELNGNTFKAANLRKPMDKSVLAAHRKALEPVVALVSAEGALLGELAVDVMRNRLLLNQQDATIRGAQQTFACPGRDRLDTSARQNVLPPYKDGADVQIKVSTVRIGDLHIVGVNAEVYTEISQRLKAESPARHTLMTTLANGSANSGYVYSNNASNHLSFQVIGSRLKPGCAENSIVDTSRTLIRAVNR